MLRMLIADMGGYFTGATIYIMNVFQHKAVINKNDKERS